MIVGIIFWYNYYKSKERKEGFYKYVLNEKEKGGDLERIIMCF